ncbi:Macrophage colony-stimulating factor 1 receptor [Gnomoniopsis smithogilvyi]|uniref:Macrophage colony-stimulating factor 1 receptor n=1 Tax=Gnomoniopsis smithogilvyi TaxID=1191159 RepID=A0A9W8YUR4_9PEZI|nr:Macrophage colony-stimulating factor 1 receptor [Gnomoniopsis smithogilvyi]
MADNPRSPYADSAFSGIFLGYCVGALALSIFFLGYFNRAFASLVSVAIRAYAWRAYGIYIDIQALQISLLGGRIFFTRLRYHGNNETILIQKGYITWSYWQWRVRDVGIESEKDEAKAQAEGKDKRKTKLPCRVNVVLSGLEWFVYNRSGAYESVLEGMLSDMTTPPENVAPQEEEGRSKLRRRAHKPTYSASGDGAIRNSFSNRGTSGEESSIMGSGKRKTTFATVDSAAEGDKSSVDDLPLLLQFFPINLECSRVGMVMGNENTKSIMIIKAKSLQGEIDAVSTETPDPYRQLYKLKFDSPVVEMRDNQDFKEDQVDRAIRERQVADDSVPLPRRSIFRRIRRRALNHVHDLVPFWQSSVESFSIDERTSGTTADRPRPGSNHWQGLTRYLDDMERNEHLKWASVEYAAVNTVLDSPEATLTIYWDTPGLVSFRRPETYGKPEDPKIQANINGDVPPAWGINLSIKGGTVNYGPWADRHRAEIQRVFFPGLCKDSQPAKPLPTGAARMPTEFKLYVELDDDVTLRIPIKEESKNWRYRGKEPPTKADRARDKRKTRNRLKQTDQTVTGGHDRQYGWLDVKIAGNSTVSYQMDMVAGPNGYSSSLNMDFPKTEISSSINHEVLWTSGKQGISCDLSTPLKWNALRQWRFDITTDDLKLYILRDHIFLLTDLVNDWSSGPPAEYLTFTPFKYFLDLHFTNLNLYLNVNDGNIINKPTDFDDNAYIIIKSPLLESSTCIALDRYRPAKNVIPFDARADEAFINIHVPPWNTQASFLKSMAMGHLENLVVDGKYHYNAITSPATTDTLVLNVTGQSPVFHLYGFVIRYFLKMKDNYFGDDVHFKTLEEYQDLQELKKADPEAELRSRPPHKKSNDMDVILSIKADDPKIFLPANLYSSERNIQIEGTSLGADLRFTNYYMDLDLTLSPLHLALGHSDTGVDTPMTASSATQLFIDGLNVYGHRVFGLPPTEPTFLCNWDLSVGAVTGECTAAFLTTLMAGGKAFALAFDDDENALIPFSATVLYDVTFLRVFVQSVRLWLHVDEAAFLFSTGSIDVNYNDWARTHYSKRADINIPDIELSCINADSISRHRARPHDSVETDLLLRTNVHLATVARKFEFSNERKLQQELIQREDQRMFRAPFLILPDLPGDHVAVTVDPPAQSVPPVPQPTRAEDVSDYGSSLSSGGSSQRSRRLQHKSSFLSMSSSSAGSVIGLGTSKRSSSYSRYPEGLRPFTPADKILAEQQNLHRRDPSASTDHRSAFYSAYGDFGDTRDQIHNTVAFSSQFFAPYFPLETVHPDTTEILQPSIESDEDDVSNETAFDLSDVDASTLKEDRAYSSILIEMPAGLTGFVNPTALQNVAALITALQPSEPEDILDTLQEEALADIFGKQKKRKIKGTISDLHVRIPRGSLRFINSSQLDSAEPSAEEQDQYDLSISDLALTTREETTWTDAFDADSFRTKNSFHTRLGLLELSAAERLASQPDTNAAAKAQIENVLVSMGAKDVTYLDGDIENIRCSVSSQEIEFLASLIHRTTTLASELGRAFASTSRGATLKQFLTYRLISEGQNAIDPTFLIRPSAVLRSATDHLRTYDSWKLTSRLRQIWMTLDFGKREQLRLECLGSAITVPDDIRQLVVSGFDRWRSWDLNNTNDSEVIQHIFGKETSASSGSPDAGLALLSVMRLRDTRFVLDPGPKQNEIVFVDITTRYQDRTLPDIEATAVPDDESEAHNCSPAIVNIYCGDAAIKLNWDLLELAQDLLKLYTKLSENERQPGEEMSEPKSLTRTSGKDLQVAVAIHRAEIAFDAINLNAATLASGMKASLLVRNSSSQVSDTDIIIGCDGVTSRLRSHGQLLGVFQLRDPAVIVSHTLQATEDTDSHTIQGSASSKELSLAVEQDPIALLEVVDLLLKDEAAQLYRLQSQLPSSSQATKQERKITERLSSFKVNVAMFLDEYYISVPLLQSLTYCISGVVARAAMAANFGKELVFNFDVKENSHEIQMRVNKQARSLSLLQIPPLNGRVKVRSSEGENLITTSASVELVKLDASAVYSLLSALNRPEISSSINDIQKQLHEIQGTIRETFKASDQEPTPQATPMERAAKPSNALVYEVHVTFEGLEIFGNSPLKSDTEPLAHILFGLGRIHLRMTNRPSASRPVLDNPEVHVHLQKIEWKIDRGVEGDFRTCGRVVFGALITATSQLAEDGSEQRHFNVTTDSFDVILSPETISTSVDVLGYMNDKIKDLDTSRELELLRKLRQTKPKIMINDEQEGEQEEPDFLDSFLTSVRYTFEIRRMQIVWLVLTEDEKPSDGKEDLVFTWDKIELGTRTRNSARLSVENFQVQTVPTSADKKMRSANSALVPEVVFNVAYVSTATTRRMAFQAVGKSLDLRLTSGFVIPVWNVVDSIQLSIKNVRRATEHWAPPTARRPSQQAESSTGRKPAEPRRPMLGNKRLESLLLDADFAGAVVSLAAEKETNDASRSARSPRAGLAGKYGQFSTDESGSGTLLKSPGIAFKVEYRDPGQEDPSLYGELKISASSNTLYPSFVPLVMDLTSSIKEVVSNDSEENVQPQQALAKAKTAQEEYLLDPSAVIGRLKLNLGMRVCKQEFTMSCQPIARVAATASFDDVYVTVNTVASVDQGKFFAISGAITNLRSSVRHVYSREETGQFNVDSIVLSLMNSKHVSGISGVSAILKFSPMEVSINAKQLQDFLLFREIWAPRDVRHQTTASPVAKMSTETSQGVLVQRYQQVAATAAFPWTATVSVAALEINVDLGQAIGKSKFVIEEFWVSSKKTSDWEQNLCLGFQRISVESQGRMSGFVALQDFQLRTSIQWPEREQALNETPMVQASVIFSQLRVKAAFDYQAFLVADITSLEFLMYNVRRSQDGSGDRLVATINGEAVQVFGTTTSAAQGVALYQAFKKLVQERKASFETSLREIEKFMKRKSVSTSTVVQRPSIPKTADDEGLSKAPISLDTDVVVTLKALNLGIFPNTFSDHQVFKAEALNAQARFAASLDDRRIHSILGLTLGQLRIGLAGVRTAGAPKALSELAVEDVVASATGSRGGTILKVPKVEAVMQTWQTPNSRKIDYIFKSAFEGKVEVGWNYSRISYIRGMWANHSRSLAQAYGKEVGSITSAIKVTGVLPEPGSSSPSDEQQQRKEREEGIKQGKITAEVDLPQSKYEYHALVPAVIETPQLRDMGEATPPLEWIGLHRERLPNLTHQIVIVSLLELAGEVEDAYSRILGSS